MFFPSSRHLRSPSLPFWSLGIWILGGTGVQAIATTSISLDPESSAILAELQPRPEQFTSEIDNHAATETDIQTASSLPAHRSSASALSLEPDPTPSASLENAAIAPGKPNSLEPESSGLPNSQALNSEAAIMSAIEHQALAESDRPQARSVTSLFPTLAVEPETITGVATTTYIATSGPENFNPELRVPPPPPPPPLPPPALPAPAPAPLEIPQETEPGTASQEPNSFKLENLQINFRDNQDQSGQHNQWIEPTAQFQLGNKGDRLLVKTGFNTFEEPETETITNIPIQIGWQTKVGKSTLQVAAGVDFFNRLPAALNLDVQASVPLTPSLTVTGVLEQGPYKANARTLENQITAWRFGPNLFWQIDRKTTLFSSFRVGLYNDGNSETQSFSRLERKFGQFHVAANLFSWNVRKDMQAQSGYFSPPNFLVYNGEIGWQGKPFDFLTCRLTANLGGQRLKDTSTNGYSYQGLCTAELSPSIEIDLGYTVSNIFTRETGESGAQSDAVVSQLRVKF
ncbi:hypothetical protein [Trichocoleus sp. FACHB-262]|uniref:hypothetical protein n=1 Tax=Trichocoleus sp. FACHB-262 TaxID=2692869 RepID=UPI0016896E21|nr:hypothetical protein [Trichocoleus sp. FACHB-262]MBD2119531.1 hypothetical protein [Trichocoleus sp. FACHB-262]